MAAVRHLCRFAQRCLQHHRLPRERSLQLHRLRPKRRLVQQRRRLER